MFSVIIPAFNRAALIGHTLDSVLRQQDGDLEVIVVDDGSTDGTVDAVNAYAPRVKLLHQENKGPGAARNAGLKAATGEYAAFLDSDDLWFPWTTRVYRAAIVANDRPAFVAGKPLIFQSGTSPAPTDDDHSMLWNTFKDYYASGDQWRWYSASSFVMRREAFLAVGGFTSDWVNAEDADAAMRMGIAGKFVQITAPFTFGYRQHANSAMANVDRSIAGIRRLIEQEDAGRFPGGASRAMDRRRILSTHARPLCLELLELGRTGPAWELYRRIFVWNLKLVRLKFLAGFVLRALQRSIGSTTKKTSAA